MNKLISIITCVYNGGKTIEDTILSVINQVYENFELLIIDGKSTDDTLKIIEKYSKIDSRIRTISELDTGIYDAYNKGIKFTSGDFIIFLNADDFFLKDALKNISSNLTMNAEVFAFDIAMLNEEYKYFKIIKRSTIRKHSVNNPVILTPALVFNRYMFKDLGVFDISFKISADYDLVSRICKKKINIKYVDKLVTIMREGGVSTNYKFEFFKKREQLNVYLRHAKPVSIKWIFNLAIRFLKTLLLNIIFKKRLLNRKRSQADLYDVNEIFWFKSNRK